MRNSRIVAIASCILALALGSTSCKKDKDGHTSGELMTIGATIVQANGDGTKTFLAPNGGKADVRWSEGDKIMLFGAGDSKGKEFTLKEGAGKTSAKFEGEVPSPFPPYYAAYPEPASFNGESTFTFTIPATIAGEAASSASSDNYSFIQKSTIPMVGVSAHGEDLQFYNAMSSIFLALKGIAKISKIVITDISGHKLNGTLTVKLNEDGTISSTMGSNGTNTLTISLGNGIMLDARKFTMLCFPVPTGAFNGTDKLKIEIYDFEHNLDNSEHLSMTITKSLTGGVAQNTTYAVVEKEVLPLVLPGVFSMSSKVSVRFTRGNLWYDGTDCHFEENQWTYPTSWNTAHVGHFYNHNDITTAAKSYAPSYSTYYQSYIFPNSGKNTANSNFTVEGLTGKCRVISDGEYQYLRDRSSDSKYGYGKVNEVDGLIFLPDSWNNPLSHTFASGSSTSYTSNKYNLDDWVIMESAGAVFFPLAGYRSSTTMNAGKSYYNSSYVSQGGKFSPLGFEQRNEPQTLDGNKANSIRLAVTVN